MQPFLFLFLFMLCSACTYFAPEPPCRPPPSAKAPTTWGFNSVEQTVIPILPDETQELALSDLVDIALQNSAKTRSAWFAAKAAASDLGVARGQYLPPITFMGQYLNQRILQLDADNQDFPFRQITWGPILSTSYLIFDFGGRNANVAQAACALNSLNWSYNWEVQSVMLDVIERYYNYLNASAIVEAAESTVKDNQTTVEAAVALRRLGVKGLADELQARTQLIQSQLTLEEDHANMQIALAKLSQSLGLPADTYLTVASLPTQFAINGICKDCATLLYTAKNRRADLMAARASVSENRAKILQAKSNFYPNIDTQSYWGPQWINGGGPDAIYSVALNLNWTIFNSFVDVNLLKKAEAEWQQAQAELDNEELEAFFEVMRDYYLFLANTEILKKSFEYIRVAKKNREVAFANYKAGVTTIIDLMTANNMLNSARQQLANAKTNWLASLANFAYDTGGLTVDSITEDQKITSDLCEEILLEETDEEWES